MKFINTFILILLISNSIFSQQEYNFNYDIQAVDINLSNEVITTKPHYKIFKSKSPIEDYQKDHKLLTEVSDTNLNY